MKFTDVFFMALIIGGALYLLYRSIWKNKGHCSGCSAEDICVGERIFDSKKKPEKKKMDTVPNSDARYKTANVLILITIFYNLAEGIVSTWFGFADGTLTLFGFGIDSFVEVISAVGVWHMISRIRASPETNYDMFERRALWITGTSFYLLSTGLVATAVINIFQHHKPDTTVWGIVISCIAIVSMWTLTHYKINIGTALNSNAILADAACSRVCLYLSVILLLASIGYELTGIGSIDAIGTIFIASFSFKEGKESFEKAKGIRCCNKGSEDRQNEKGL